MDMRIIESVREELASRENPEGRRASERFFKEPIKTYGWKSADTHKLAWKYYDRAWTKDEVLSLCEELMRSGYNEEFFIACDWCRKAGALFEAGDFETIERFVKKYISNWAQCDTFCTACVGVFLENYPSFVEGVKAWAKEESRWVQRASAVSFILPAKRGLFKEAVFAVADMLIGSEDDLVQKGYGWALKSLSCSEHVKEVYAFVVARRKEMPRTAYRYALEKMPAGLRSKAMRES